MSFHDEYPNAFQNQRGRVIAGEGYQVEAYGQGGIRYSEGGRKITLPSEIVDASATLGKIWFFIPRTMNILYVPHILKWDDGEVIQSERRQVILGRIEEALARIKEPCKIVVTERWD